MLFVYGFGMALTVDRSDAEAVPIMLTVDRALVAINSSIVLLGLGLVLFVYLAVAGSATLIEGIGTTTVPDMVITSVFTTLELGTGGTKVMQLAQQLPQLS